jgi:hypothetical protein
MRLKKTTPIINIDSEIMVEKITAVIKFGSAQNPARYMEIIPVMGLKYDRIWYFSGMSEIP